MCPCCTVESGLIVKHYHRYLVMDVYSHTAHTNPQAAEINQMSLCFSFFILLFCFLFFGNSIVFFTLSSWTAFK